MTNENNRYGYVPYFDDDYLAWQEQRLERQNDMGPLRFLPFSPPIIRLPTKLGKR